MIISGVHQNSSVTHTHVSNLFKFFSHFGSYIILRAGLWYPVSVCIFKLIALPRAVLYDDWWLTKPRNLGLSIAEKLVQEYNPQILIPKPHTLSHVLCHGKMCAVYLVIYIWNIIIPVSTDYQINSSYMCKIEAILPI